LHTPSLHGSTCSGLCGPTRRFSAGYLHSMMAISCVSCLARQGARPLRPPFLPTPTQSCLQPPHFEVAFLGAISCHTRNVGQPSLRSQSAKTPSHLRLRPHAPNSVGPHAAALLGRKQTHDCPARKTLRDRRHDGRLGFELLVSFEMKIHVLGFYAGTIWGRGFTRPSPSLLPPLHPRCSPA
jgi:hypothetical protein